VTIQSNERWLSLIDSFQSAALSERPWADALQDLAVATGSQSAQLIGRTGDLAVIFNVMANADPAFTRLSEDLQSINPRPPVVRETPVLEPVADWDVLPPEEWERNAFYGEVLRPWDRPFFCATVLERHDDAFITLGVMRSQAAGYIGDEERRTFALLAPHVRAAIRLHARVEQKGVALLAGAIEALSIPMFICDGTRRVRMLTPSAEALVASGSSLQLKSGQLTSARADEARALQDAIDAALPAYREPDRLAFRTVVIRGREPGATPIVLEVFAFPARSGVLSLASIAPQVLVVACGGRKNAARRAAIFGAVYGLTAAEAEIAQRLAGGELAQTIATVRGVAVGTVRTQIKAILAKVGVRRQIELTARLNQL
jgi:DNA-binding CsgD family transcriptional regulator